MTLARDEFGGGTNADGSRSREYCSRCYVDGRFTSPGLTVAQMQARVRSKMREMGMPRLLRWYYVRRIPRLGRWITERSREPGP